MTNNHPSLFFQLNESQKNQLQQELETLLKERKFFQQSLQQKLAETKAEQEELFLELLEVFDALEFFLNYLAEHPDPNPNFFKRLPKSISTIQKKLLNVLARRKVQLIELQDNQPDYSICQVVEREVREDLAEQTITKVVRQGFKVESKILRPVEVIITQKPSS
jgi:molecular chaperone GrpE